VDTNARRSVALLLDARPTYIKDEIAKVREAFRQTDAADERLTASVMELVDAMEWQVEARAHSLGANHGEAEDVSE